MMKTFVKFFKFFGIILLFIIPTIYVEAEFELSIWRYLYYFLVIIILVIMAIKIFKNKKGKTIDILICIFLLLIIFDFIYYIKISMNIEPLIYMHNKYGVPYSEMSLVESKSSYNPIVGAFQPRESIIKIDNVYVNLHYGSKLTSEKQGWKDNYQISKKIGDILIKYTSDYNYYTNYDSDCYYSILMKKNQQYKMLSVIEDLKKIEQEFEKLSYDITFVDENHYERIINNKCITISKGNIANINYKDIDNYYDSRDFVSKELLTSEQIEQIEKYNINVFNFEYSSDDTDVYIEGYEYIDNYK